MAVTLLEAGLTIVVLILLFDRMCRRNDRKRIGELEEKLRVKEIHDRVTRSSIPDLVERANRRWLDKHPTGKGSREE